MPTATAILDSPRYDLSSETTWLEIYPWLHCLARKFVYSLHVPYWKGQEEDLIEDVVQDTARRIIERSKRAEHGEAASIQSLEYRIAAIVRTYCVDLNRRDRRFVRTPSDDRSFEVWDAVDG